jgi:membrane protease YdiL (CAAX protease family)
MNDSSRPGSLATPGTAPGPVADDPSLRPLLVFAAIAVTTGCVLLGVGVALGLPSEPFALATLLVGMVLPALVITALQARGAGVRALLRDAVRPPCPLWWSLFAVLAFPVLTWTGASMVGGEQPLTSSLLIGFAVQLVTGAIIINIWEEMVLTGFVQRRSMARWGAVGGSVATAAVFVGIHLPLAFDVASDAGDVALGVTALVAIGVGLRFLIAGVDTWSGRSLLTVGVLHASFNATADLLEPGFDWVRYVVTVLLGLVAITVLLSRREGRALPRQRLGVG